MSVDIQLDELSTDFTALVAAIRGFVEELSTHLAARRASALCECEELFKQISMAGRQARLQIDSILNRHNFASSGQLFASPVPDKVQSMLVLRAQVQKLETVVHELDQRRQETADALANRTSSLNDLRVDHVHVKQQLEALSCYHAKLETEADQLRRQLAFAQSSQFGSAAQVAAIAEEERALRNEYLELRARTAKLAVEEAEMQATEMRLADEVQQLTAVSNATLESQAAALTVAVADLAASTSPLTPRT